MLWLGRTFQVAEWLVVIVVAVPLVQLAVISLSRLAPHAVSVTRIRPRLAMITVVLLLATPMLFIAGLVATANHLRAEVAAVDPAGWQRYQSSPGAADVTLPILLQDSSTPLGLRQVSYPDAALLEFENNPVPGQIVGLKRTLDGLEAGRLYHFYLQIFNPGLSGNPGETLTVTLNHNVVWQQSPNQAQTASWQYLRLPWVADGSEVTIRVERQAGSDTAIVRRATPLVRNLHLYPKY
jgi:hypothetical protein